MTRWRIGNHKPRQSISSNCGHHWSRLHCDVQYNSGLLNIIVVYRPPPKKRNGHMVGVFLDEFLSLLEDRMFSPGSLVSRIVMKSSTKAFALDPMQMWLLKELLPSIAPLKTDFINSSLQPDVVPDSMKSAAVTPLLKKPSLDINILKNYRLVSNLPFVSKVLE